MSSELRVRLFRCASDIGISLDEELTSISFDTRNKLVVVATILLIPDSDEARRDMRAALHATILDEFQPSFPDVSVAVHAACACMPSVRVSNVEFLKQQSDAVDEYATLCAQLLLSSGLKRIVASYPWRKKQWMRTMLPVLVMRGVMLMSRGVSDAAAQTFDMVLPDFDASVPWIGVGKDVAKYLGRLPSSRLEILETIYDMVRTRNVPSPDVLQAYDMAFLPQ